RLANVDARNMLGQHILDRFQQSGLAGRFQLGFELVSLVEMVFDGALVTPRNEDHFIDAGRDCLLDRILDQRLVDYRQHFLWLRLGGRQESATQTGDRKNGLSDRFHCSTPFCECSKSSSCCSSRTVTPSSCALANLLPASSPATT